MKQDQNDNLNDGPKAQRHLDEMRHSAAHVLASAVLKLYPDTKLGIGPAIENGFYYDFEFSETLSENDFAKIEEEMKKEIKKNYKFEKEELSIKEAKKVFKRQPYKLELIEAIAKGELDDPSQPQEGRGVPEEKVSIYRHGDFVDLCRGPHVESTGNIGPFKLVSLAGAYWRGNEKNPQLTRIYGIAFEKQEELDHYLWQIEENKKRDHRKLGKELELFIFTDEVGPGLPLWLPNGYIIREQLENWAKETEKREGYLRVRTPHITKEGLYHTSGHLPYYADDMFPPMEVDEEKYYLKPMNCPHHHMIYKAKIRSYRDLPLKLAEYGEVYRYERTGELHGMLRVRFITQNDAHIYCTLEQAKEEFKKVIKLHEYYYEVLGIKDYYMELSLRDPNNKEKYHGDEEMWKLAEELTRSAMEESDVPYVAKEGTAAFYGPKVDFNIKSVTGKEYSASTNQLDLYMAKRFGLEYIGPDGKEHHPVIIHRAPLGSHERFVGFLIEHFGGAFPVWLSPIQVVIIPVSDRNREYADRINKVLNKNEIRAEVNEKPDSMQAKIREAQLRKVPYMIIIGDREEKDKSISLRLRTGEEYKDIKVDEFLEIIKNIIEDKSLKIY